MKLQKSICPIAILTISTACQSRNFDPGSTSSPDFFWNNREKIPNLAQSEDEQFAEKEKLRFLEKERKQWIEVADKLIESYKGKELPGVLNFYQKLKDFFDPEKDAPPPVGGIPVEGSGLHGELKDTLKEADNAYHKLWSGVAIAAGLAGFPQSAKHMNHYLRNSGEEYTFSEKDVARLVQEMNFAKPEVIKGVAENKLQMVKDEAAKSGQDLDFEMAESSFKMGAYQYRIHSNISKLKDRLGMMRFEKAQNFREWLKSQMAKDGSLSLERPIERHYSRIAAKQGNDWFYALGNFSSVVTTVPLVAEVKEESVVVNWVSYLSIFDRYNWDGGKSVQLFNHWCVKLQNVKCSNLEEFFAIKVSDASIGRLHKVGLAQEFIVRGISKLENQLEEIPFNKFSDYKRENTWKVMRRIDPAEHYFELDAGNEERQ
jgi:hypothetical protein